MENYNETGLFRLPRNAEDQVVGDLVFDVREGVSLKLRRPSDDTWPENPGIIVGTAGAQEVTLLDPYESSRTRSMPNSLRTQVFHANKLLLGHAFDRREDVAFTSATISYYGLGEWVNQSGVTADYSDEGTAAVIRYEQPESASVRFANGTISLDFSWTSQPRTEETMLTHSPYVRIEYDEAFGYEEILKHAKRIQDFMTLCTDKAVAFKNVTFSHRDIPMRMIDGSTRGRQSIEYRAPLITSPEFSMKSQPEYPLELSYDAVGGVETIARWMQTATEYATAVNLLTPFRSEMRSFVENRFLNVAGAAEAFYDLKYPEGKHVEDPAEWAKLQKLILSAVPEEHREWISQELPRINRPSLSKRLTVLGRQTKEITGRLSGRNADKIKRWAGVMAPVRNGLTHRRSEEEPFPGGALHWLTESVYQVLRVCLLKECITDNDLFDRLTASPGCPDVEARVQAALTRAYEILQRRPE
jgi:hypothetical protein